jgi:hypothetical protein
MFQVVPVGIFQPSGEAPWNAENDFSLWRGLVREYAEELLGAAEDYGSERAPIDYAGWPFAARMTEALADGRIRAWCLGLGADPLTFAMDLLTVVVIDAPLYDELFAAAVTDNAEGTVLPPRPFDAATVSELIDGHPVQAAGAALLRLALANQDMLLAGLPDGPTRPRRLPAALAPLPQVVFRARELNPVRPSARASVGIWHRCFLLWSLLPVGWTALSSSTAAVSSARDTVRVPYPERPIVARLAEPLARGAAVLVITRDDLIGSPWFLHLSPNLMA